MIELSREEYEKFKKLSNKRKYRFWGGGFPLMSDRARFIIPTPRLTEELIKEIRKSRRNG